MSKINDLAKEYADYLLAMRRDTTTAILEIENRIKSLSYTSSGNPISKEDKDNLLNEMERLLNTPHSGLITESEDSKEFTILIDLLRDRLGK